MGFLDDKLDMIPLSPRKRGILDGVRLETDENIEKMMDVMPVDDSSSEEEGLVGGRGGGLGVMYQ